MQNSPDYNKEKDNAAHQWIGWEHQNLIVRKLKKLQGMDRHQAILFLNTLPFITNQNPLFCILCSSDEVPAGGGVILKECLHFFCKRCLKFHIHQKQTSDIPCPFIEDGVRCPQKLLPTEVEALVTSAEFKRHYVDLVVKETKQSLEESHPGLFFHCLTLNCSGYCVKEQVTNTRQFFHCPNCNSENCLKCNAQHNYKVSCANDKKDTVQQKAPMKKTQESSCTIL